MVDDDLWERLMTQLDNHTENIGAWRRGADAREIRRAEAAIGVRLPKDYAAFLQRHDGQGDDYEISILSTGGRLAPLEEVVRQHEAMRDSHDETYFDELDDGDRIRGVTSHPKRVDIGGSLWFDGDNTILDFVPGPKGTEGQVLAKISEFEYVVVGTSFTDFIRRVVTALEEGTITFEERGPLVQIRPSEKTEYHLRCEDELRAIEPAIE